LVQSLHGFRCHRNVAYQLAESEHCSGKEDTLLHVDAANPSLSLNKSQARELTKRIAHTLRYKYGIGSKKELDYVTCISAGNYVLPTVFLGVAAAGGVFSSVSSSATVQELARLIKSAPSNLVICSPETQAVAVQAANASGVAAERVLVVDAPNVALREVVSGQDILGKETMEWKRLSKEEAENIPVCLIYSSGTTGLPKGRSAVDQFHLKSETDNCRCPIIAHKHGRRGTPGLWLAQTPNKLRLSHDRSSSRGPHRRNARVVEPVVIAIRSKAHLPSLAIL
jgi:acyl-coenzyme A synthetase/AMP-(fatty) acid ligase